MKNFYLTILFISQVILLPAKGLDFSEANAAYKLKDYKKAVELYSQLLESGRIDANLYFNIGNTYCKLYDYPNAIYYFEKAAKINPRDGDIRNNLAFAYQKISKKYPDVAIPYPNTKLDKVVTRMNLSQWSKSMVIFLWLGVLAFVLYMYLKSNPIKKYVLILTFSLLSGSLFFLSMTFLRIQYDKVNRFVIVEAENIYSKSDPSYSADNVYILVEGQKLKILDQTGDWIKVRNGNGDEGWMAMQNAKPL